MMTYLITDDNGRELQNNVPEHDRDSVGQEWADRLRVNVYAYVNSETVIPGMLEAPYPYEPSES